MPVLLLAAVPMFVNSGAEQMPIGGLLAQPFRMALGFVLLPFVNAVWVLSAESKRSGSETGSVLSKAGSRLADFGAVFGAKQLVVTLGMQVIVPGVYYALQFAFVEMVALLRPDSAAMRRSKLLTRGIRIKLFRMFAVWFCLYMSIFLAVAGVLDEPGAVVTFFVFADPRLVSLGTIIALDLAFSVTSWWLVVSLLHLYHHREEEVVRLREARRAKREVLE